VAADSVFQYVGYSAMNMIQVQRAHAQPRLLQAGRYVGNTERKLVPVPHLVDDARHNNQLIHCGDLAGTKNITVSDQPSV